MRHSMFVPAGSDLLATGWRNGEQLWQMVLPLGKGVGVRGGGGGGVYVQQTYIGIDISATLGDSWETGLSMYRHVQALW